MFYIHKDGLGFNGELVTTHKGGVKARVVCGKQGAGPMKGVTWPGYCHPSIPTNLRFLRFHIK